MCILPAWAWIRMIRMMGLLSSCDLARSSYKSGWWQLFAFLFLLGFVFWRILGFIILASSWLESLFLWASSLLNPAIILVSSRFSASSWYHPGGFASKIKNQDFSRLLLIILVSSCVSGLRIIFYLRTARMHSSRKIAWALHFLPIL